MMQESLAAVISRAAVRPASPAPMITTSVVSVGVRSAEGMWSRVFRFVAYVRVQCRQLKACPADIVQDLEIEE
jgi:hypothetical protein